MMINAAAEMAEASLGDPRRVSRLVTLVAALGKTPDASFPDIFRTDADLEAAYRFFNNPYVSLDRILEPHRDATVRRAQAQGNVVVAHDTTECAFSGDKPREGLGRLRQNDQGFFAHTALAVSVDGSVRAPLGVVGMEILVRSELKKGKRTPAQIRRDPNNEQLRWARLIGEVDDNLRAEGVSAVHVMDREGDDYAGFSTLVRAGRRFISRASHDRAIDVAGESSSVFAAMQTAPRVIEREVTLSRRVPRQTAQQRRIYPARDGRVAKLAFAAMPVQVKRPKHALSDELATLPLNLVRVWEVDCPADQAPVEWLLVTTEPIDSPDSIVRVIDMYRARWLIEEFFKALKTGCAYEKRQLESKHALLNALGISIPIAVHLLRIRWFGRGSLASAPATEVLAAAQLHALAAMQPAQARKWDAVPTTQDVMLAIAAAGGHIKNNGLPGWLVLARGFTRFLEFLSGWDAAINRPTQICDQS